MPEDLTLQDIVMLKDIVSMAEKLADKFVKKCEHGLARSIETKKDCQDLLAAIKKYEESKKKLNGEVKR